MIGLTLGDIAAELGIEKPLSVGAAHFDETYTGKRAERWWGLVRHYLILVDYVGGSQICHQIA